MRNELSDRARIPHHNAVLELDVKDHIHGFGCKWLVELIARLLPSRNPVRWSQDFDQTKKLSKPERVTQPATA
jgi:hypothetical protein